VSSLRSKSKSTSLPGKVSSFPVVSYNCFCSYFAISLYFEVSLPAKTSTTVSAGLPPFPPFAFGSTTSSFY